MMKIPFNLFFVALLSLLLSAQTLMATETNWLDLVHQRLKLEKSNPQVLINSRPNDPEAKQGVLDHALVFYNQRFQLFYKSIMPIFDSCTSDKETAIKKEWCALKDDLVKSKKMLDEKFDKLKKDYYHRSVWVSFEDSTMKKYQESIEAYYKEIIEVLRRMTNDGQDKKVKLLKEVFEEKRQEKRREKRSDEAAILHEEI